MKKILLFAAVLGLSVSCIDKDFDLSNIDTDDVGIGSADSEFRLPLANITVKASALQDVNGVNFSEIFDEADTWLPSPDRIAGGSISLQQASHNASYRAPLIESMLSEAAEGGQKLTAVTKLVHRKYKSAFADIISGIESMNETQLFSALKTGLTPGSQSHAAIRAKLYELADNNIKGIDTIEIGNQNLDALDIDDGVIEALTQSGELAIYGTVKNYMPLSNICTIAITPDYDMPEEVDDNGIHIMVGMTANGTTSMSESDNMIGADDLRVLTSDARLIISLLPDEYYPGKERPRGDEDALELHLKLYKKGGLSIKDI